VCENVNLSESADRRARVSLLARLFETSEEFLMGDGLIAGSGDDA
jgi:hypothetical protein